MAKYKVLVTARSFGTADSKALELLEANDCEVKKLVAADGPIPEQLKKELPEADAVIAGLEDYDEALIACGKNLKVISRYGVGYDRVDVNAAKEHGITVTNTPGVNSEAVGELAFALILAVARKIPYLDQDTRKGGWTRSTGFECKGKTICILGLGSIGKVVARCAQGFGMTVCAYDPYINAAYCEENEIERPEDLRVRTVANT